MRDTIKDKSSILKTLTWVPVFILFFYNCKNEEISKQNQKLIIGEWVIDSIKTSSRRLVIGSDYCILGRPGKRHYLRFMSEGKVIHTRTDQNITNRFSYIIQNDSVLIFSGGLGAGNRKTIHLVNKEKLILSDTAKIDGCLFRRPAYKGDISWPFEKVYYFYHRD